MSNETTNRPTEGTNTPRREAIPINGQELMLIILGSMAKRMLDTSALQEIFAYPGAKVQFAVAITPQTEDTKAQAWQESFTLDFSNPPDVVRILSGLPVWEQFKVQLDRYVQLVERPVVAGPELKKAAEKVAGVPSVQPGRQHLQQATQQTQQHPPSRQGGGTRS